MAIWPGRPYPLGATRDPSGTNFALFSGAAERVELCLFGDRGRESRVDLPEMTGHCWHGFVPGLGAGQRYGFRVHGPFAPEQGHRCNPSKLLLDPYAKAIEGKVEWDEAVYGYPFGSDALDLERSETDSAPFMPKSVVVDTA